MGERERERSEAEIISKYAMIEFNRTLGHSQGISKSGDDITKSQCILTFA